MKMQAQGTLTGVQRGKGEGVIDGKQLEWDYTKFHIISQLPSKGDNARGEATQEYKFGLSAEFDKWKNIPLPATVDLEFAVTTNGKGMQQTELVAIKPQPMQPTRVK
jgi:hypothetical protein